MEFVYGNFDLLFDEAGSVDAFKKVVLETAFKGKLVYQDPMDESADSLLVRIKNNKEALVLSNKLKKEKQLKPVEKNEIPYTLPDNWAWARLGDIVTYGQNISVQPINIEENAWIIELEDIEKNSSRLIKRRYFYERKPKSTKNSFRKGDVLYGKLRPYLNKVIVADQDGFCSSEIIPIKTYGLISSKYLMYALKRKGFIAYINRCMYGTKMPRLRTEDARNAIVPLPPLNEQKRIVQKIDEIFEMIPHLEEAFEKRTKYNRQLNLTSLNRLTNASCRGEFVSSMHFVTNNFDSLYDNIENVKELRQAILTLAVQGKLVPQDPSDEPASVLLDKIQKEKELFVQKGELKNDKSLPSIKEKNLPYPLPHNWMWIRIGEIIHNKFTGIVRSSGQQNKAYKYPYFKMNNINNDGSCNFKSIINVNATESEASKFKLEENDFLFNTRNSRELVGKTCVVENIPFGVLLFNNNILKIEFYKQFINNKYINLWFNSTPGKKLLNHYKSNTTNVCAIYQKQLVTYPIPIPPLNEQKRIVDRVGEALLFCDDLESHLTSFEKFYQQLLTVVLYEAI